MTVSKTRLQRQSKDRRQERKFFIILGIITVALIIILFIAYG